MTETRYPMPKYFHLRLALENIIIEEGLQAGSRLPSEPELTRKYKVSVASVRRCLYDMVKDGVIFRKHGLGTFVKNPGKIRRGNRLGNHQTVGLIIPNITGGFFPPLAKGVEDAAHKHGYNVILCNSDDTVSKEVLYLKQLYARNVCGLVIGPGLESYRDEYIETIQDAIPIVVVDSPFLGRVEFDCVVTDDLDGAFKATNHLIELGHTRIAHIRGPQPASTAAWREEGYRKALNNRKLPLDEDLIAAVGNAETERGYKTARHLLGLKKRPTAIFAYNDGVALGAILAIEEAGLDIPKDISVVGYGDVLGNHSYVPLTTVRQPSYKMGDQAMDALQKLIEGKKSGKYRRIELKTELVIRTTSAPSAVNGPRSGRAKKALPEKTRVTEKEPACVK